MLTACPSPTTLKLQLELLMSEQPNEDFPVLDHPPVAEVVCGVHFGAIPAINPVVVGVYWQKRKAEFPEVTLQPAISDGQAFILGTPPLRVMVGGEDKVYLLQLQHDRFFMNWRAKGEDYPRFSDRPGKPQGLKTRAIREFGQFARFLEDELGTKPQATRVELTKIDQLERGRHWSDLPDLARLVPITGTLGKGQDDVSREFGFRFVEHYATGPLTVAINSVVRNPKGIVEGLRIETRTLISSGVDDLSEAFTKANRQVNSAFFRLLEKKELDRFMAKEGEANHA